MKIIWRGLYITIIFMACFYFLLWNFVAYDNYLEAKKAIRNSDGTDLGIEIALSQYNFTNDWHEEIGYLDILKAVTKEQKQPDYTLELLNKDGLVELVGSDGKRTICELDSLVVTLIRDNE